MKIALIGCGRIAQVAHLPALARIPEFKLVGVMDASSLLADGVAAQYGARSYTDLDQMLTETTPAAVIIAVPDRLHHELAIRCLRAGKDVLLEKPLSSTVEQGQLIIDAVRDTGHLLQVATMKRHDPGVAYARKVIAEELGPVLSFTAWYRATSMRDNVTALFPPVVSDTTVTATERTFKADTGVYWLNTHASHLFDTIGYVLDDQFASLTAYRNDHAGDISWQIAGRLTGGAVGTADLTVNIHGDGAEGMDIRCERGHLTLSTFLPFAKRASEVRVYRDSTETVSEPVLGYADAYENQLRAFLSACTARRTALPMPALHGDLGFGAPASVDDGQQVLKMLAAVTTSAASETPVSLR